MGPREMGPQRKGENMSEVDKSFRGQLSAVKSCPILSDVVRCCPMLSDFDREDDNNFPGQFFAFSLRPHLWRPHFSLPN